jgi:hypothetical protein
LLGVKQNFRLGKATPKCQPHSYKGQQHLNARNQHPIAPQKTVNSIEIEPGKRVRTTPAG